MHIWVLLGQRRQKSNFRMGERWRSGLKRRGDRHIGSSWVLVLYIAVFFLFGGYIDHAEVGAQGEKQMDTTYLKEYQGGRNLVSCLCNIMSPVLLRRAPIILLQRESQS